MSNKYISPEKLEKYARELEASQLTYGGAQKLAAYLRDQIVIARGDVTKTIAEIEQRIASDKELVDQLLVFIGREPKYAPPPTQQPESRP